LSAFHEADIPTFIIVSHGLKYRVKRLAIAAPVPLGVATDVVSRATGFFSVFFFDEVGV